MYNLETLTDSDKRHICGMFEPQIRTDRPTEAERAQQIGDTVQQKRESNKAKLDRLINDIIDSLRV